MNEPLLFVDDDADQCELVQTLLEARGYRVRTTTAPHDALEILGSEDIQIVLTDLAMNEMDGITLCGRILSVRPDAVVIVVTGRGDLETAIAAIRAGAFDYLTKPIDPKLLELAIARASAHGGLRTEARALRRIAADRPAGLIGDSSAMRRVYDLLHRISDTDASAVIQGETGTGKELIARAIHAMSARREKPFVAINCAAVPPLLIESELFGHARGAFTDAKTARAGLFVEANGGTLFLDEIGEMPLEMQTKLLRALQEKKVRPVGESREVPFDARVVVATHRDLESEVYEKRFREDLYYRVNVVRIDLPPLRDRRSDILKLASHFIAREAKALGKQLAIPPAVAERLMAYDWPGNVRELENAVARLVALAPATGISVDDLPVKIRTFRAETFVVDAESSQDVVTVDELERRYIARVLKLVAGNKSRAASMLGFDRRTLYRKLERFAADDAKSGRGPDADR